jgi:hypothetical protein
MNVKKKREKIGSCNICLKVSNLTWDHVPPKGGIKLSSMEIGDVWNVLANKIEPYPIFSQSGVRYRTLCKECNSRLGSEYDKVFNEFNRNISLFLRSGLALPSFTYIKTIPARLIRAILGHLMAAKLSIDDAVFDSSVRDFILSDDDPCPENIHIHYWIYSYDCTIIARDFAMAAVRGDMSQSLFGHVLKYFPMAFLISDRPEYCGLPALTRYRNLSINDESEVRIDLRRFEVFDWPERVDDGNILFATAETQKGIFAKPR